MKKVDPVRQVAMIPGRCGFTTRNNHVAFGILHKNWNKLVRKALSEKLDISKVIAEQLSGAGIRVEDVLEAKR